MDELEQKVEFSVNGSTNFSVEAYEAFGEFQRGNYVFDQPLYAVLICTYIPLFLIALLSNILIILVVGRYRCLRSVTNYFLVNLSVADLLVTLICMPVAVGQSITRLWIYGAPLCKLTFYLQGVAVGASVFTITVMSIDRYLAIRHPMSRKIITRKTTRKVIFCLWTLSLVIFSPILFIRKISTTVFILPGQTYEHKYCIESWPDWPAWPDNLLKKTFGVFCFVIVYAIPGIIVVLAYSLMGLRLCSRHLLPEYHLTPGMSSPSTTNGLSQFDSSNSAWQVSSVGGRLIRERRRVAKILLILALVFAMCWLPYSVLSLILDLQSEKDELWNFAMHLLPFAILLGHVNSAVNPLLYCLLSKKFRRSVTELIRHPTRTLRSRQPQKIRMTFRKNPAMVQEKNSSKEQVSNHRPRNHYTPDPAEAHSASSSHGAHGSTIANRVIPTGRSPSVYLKYKPELCAIDKKKVGNGEVACYSQSSSGYSSLRHSLDALTLATINKENNVICQCSHFVSRKTDKNCPYCSNWNSSACLAEQYNTLSSKLNLGQVALKRLHLPSMIREESHSNQKSEFKVYLNDLYLKDTVVRVNTQ